MKRMLTVAIAGLMMAVIVHAETGITGKWHGKTANGFEIVLDLTATKTRLTGTLTREGQIIPLADGRVSNDTFTFKATLNDQPEGFTGEFAGDDMKVWLDRQGPQKAAILKRSKK